MKQKKIIEAVEAGIARFLESKKGEALIGTIMLKAINQSLTRKVRFEDGKSEPGRTVERTETVNAIDWMIKYAPYMEAALRGVQSDAASARNCAAEARDIGQMVIEMAKTMESAIDLALDRPSMPLKLVGTVSSPDGETG